MSIIHYGLLKRISADTEQAKPVPNKMLNNLKNNLKNDVDNSTNRYNSIDGNDISCATQKHIRT